MPPAPSRPSTTRAGGSTAAASRADRPAVSLDPVAHNRTAWDHEVEGGNEWTVPVTPEVIARARSGDWSVVLIGHEPVPRDWLPAKLEGVAILGLASGGGQQGPTLAAAGANVTILDNSPRQLERDRMVAEREGLALTTVLGDMRDLSHFPDASFDLVFHPVSNLFCPDILPVWREAFRVLRPGGELLAGFMNPDLFIFDFENPLRVRHALPYSDLTHLSEEERLRVFGPHAPVEYSHSLTAQLGGQMAAGFVLLDFREAPHHAHETARYMPGYFATRARKPKQFTSRDFEGPR